MTPADRILRPGERIAGRMVGATAVLVRLPEGELFTLNPSGSALYSLLDGTRTRAAAVREAGERWGGAARADAPAFCDALLDAGLVEAHDAPAPVAAPLAAPALGAWTAPAVETQEAIETLASGCDSSHTGQADCMVWDGGCTNGWF